MWVSKTSQRELGDSDSPIEDELEDAFQRMIAEGTQRLHRPWREVLTTGFFGGTEVAMGVLAYLSVLNVTHEPMVAGPAFHRLPCAAARPQRAVH
jgi:formate-nitrite transporter family protein